MENNANPLMALLTAVLSGYSAQPGATNAQTFNAQPQSAYLPIGCTHVLPDGRYIGKDVNELVTWDNHVECENGGTYMGIKVMYLGLKPIKHSEKSFSSRDGQMARFEICKAGGRNPMNEVINVFIKHEGDYKPYLNPKNWAVKSEVIVFKSEEPAEEDRIFRPKMIYFMDELISDSLERKAAHIAKRVGGMYECYIAGEKVEFEAGN